MAWIKTISESEAEGKLKREYDSAIKRVGKVADIIKVMSLNGETLQASMRLYGASMFGQSNLSRQLREMIATVVSRANDCGY